MRNIYIVGTADTKPEELTFLRQLIAANHPKVMLVDIGTRPPRCLVDISAEQVAACHPDGAAAVLAHNDRGQAVATMGLAFARFITTRTDIAGVIGIGGGGGTSIVCSGLRELPLGLPKLMLSTIASGDVAPFVDVSDITMMPSITDLAGLNNLSRQILHNAASAITGMAQHPPVTSTTQSKPAIGLTMFGVTTPCVTTMADALNSHFDPLIFHATGTGGRAMEKLADSGMLCAIADITTTEVTDMIVGGVLPATQDRFGALARTRLPCVIAPGALDIVNFWGPTSVPSQFAKRFFYHHNPNVTLMRTTAQEGHDIGTWIAKRLNECSGEIRFLVPEKGLSTLDIDGGVFHDPHANAALFTAIETQLEITPKRRIQRLPLHINDPEFAAIATAALQELLS